MSLKIKISKFYSFQMKVKKSSKKSNIDFQLNFSIETSINIEKNSPNQLQMNIFKNSIKLLLVKAKYIKN